MHQQLFTDLNTDCDSVSIHEAHETLLKITLISHEYIIAAKCTVINFISDLKYEAAVYTYFYSIQSIHISVYLENVNFKNSYNYDDMTKLVHMIFLSFEKKSIHQLINFNN